MLNKYDLKKIINNLYNRYIKKIYIDYTKDIKLRF